MEKWQTEYITEHLVDLISLTTFNTDMEARLLQENILSHIDAEVLRKEDELKGRSAASKKLFDVLSSRTNSYKAVAKAAYHANQSGTFLILLTGLLKYLLRQTGIDLEEPTLEAILKTECQRDDTLKFFVDKMDKPNLFEDNWVPAPRGGIYIDRQLSNRVLVDPIVFKQKRADIFVFTGIPRPMLTTLAAPHGTASSGDVILKRNTISRFIFLEHEEDWDQLMLFMSGSTTLMSTSDKAGRPLHLIQYDVKSQEYILLKSTGSSKLAFKHVPPHMRDKSLYISENYFCHEITRLCSQNAFCICDTPGMGKTWLLENLARQLQKLRSNRILAFISLSEFTQRVILPTTKDNTNSCKILTLFYFLCPFRLMQMIMVEIIKSQKIQLDLFLDGFDEVPKEYLESVKQFFKGFAESQNQVRLFVTSRPHMRHELERTFQATAYDIMPFSEEDQVKYLVGFWERPGDTPEKKTKLREFALACLKVLRRSLTKPESDLMGIPLQCYLLATVNQQYAYLYCSRVSRSAEEFVSATSMDDMYIKYVKMGIERTLGIGKPTHENLRKRKRINSNEDHLNNDKIQKIKTFHVWKALELLYPSLADVYFQSQNMVDREPSTEVFSCGLLQLSSENKEGHVRVTFLHRTFAEFLVAELFAEIFAGHKDLENFVEFFFTQIKSDTSSVLMTFINARLDRLKFVSVPEKLARRCTGVLEEFTVSNILLNAISSNHGYIIRLVKSILSQAFPFQTAPQNVLRCSHYEYFSDETQDEDYRSRCEYLCHVAKYFSHAIVEELYSLYEECFGDRLDMIYANMPTTHLTPLHIALKERNYSVVEYFSGRISLSERGLLHHCVEKTKHIKDNELKVTIDICTLLLGKCDTLLDEHGLNTTSGPLFAELVHVELIKFLVLQNADTLATTPEGDNLVTWHFHWLDKGEFAEVLRFLIFDAKTLHFFTSEKDEWKKTLMKIIGGIDVATLKVILDIPGINLTALDDEKNNLLLSSIRPEGDLQVVELLIEKGVDLHHKNEHGKGALHFAVEWGTSEFVDFFTLKELSLEDPDTRGNRPLHCAYKRLEMVKHLISQNANVEAVNKNGDNIAHLAASRSGWGDEVVGYITTIKNAHSIFQMKNGERKTALDILYDNNYFPLDNGIKTDTITGRVETTEIRFCLALVAIKSGQDKEVLKRLMQEVSYPSVVERLKQITLNLEDVECNLEVTQYLISLGLQLKRSVE